MTALSQELTTNYPVGIENSVAGFRAALVAMGREMHDETQFEHQSLWTWWQWLDDEGYERQAFAEVLRQVGRTTIGDEAFAELAAYSKSIENDPDGISTLIEYTNNHYPDLAQKMAKIEKMAEEEENQIQNMAGGMSKGAKDALIGVGTVAGVGLVGLGVKGIHSYWKRTKAEREPRLVENVEIKATNDVQQETRKLENFAIENGRARELAPQAATKVEKNLADGIGLREQEREAKEILARSVENEKGGVKNWLREEMAGRLADARGEAKNIISEEDQEAINRIIDEKFMPSEKAIETYLGHNENSIIDLGKELKLEQEMIGLATRAELRKDRNWLGNVADKELLRPELETVFSDKEINNLFDFDKLIVDLCTGDLKDKELKQALDFWGKSESFFAKGFDQRHPSFMIGMREQVRELALGDMPKFNRLEALDNLENLEAGGLEKYLKVDVCQKMKNEAKKQAAKEAEFVMEKTNYKAEVQEIIDKKIPELKKEVAEEVLNKQQILDRETERLWVEEQTRIRQKGMSDAAKKWDDTYYIANKTAERLKQKTNSIVNEDEELIKQAEADWEEDLIV